MSLIERDRKVVWHPFTQVQTDPAPLPIVSAKGSLLYDEQGKSYIDCNSSWWVNVHGHGNPRIGKAIEQQFKTLDHIVFAGSTHLSAVELAECVIDLLPDGFSKVFYSDNGSTAVEVALKMAIQYWHNQNIEKTRFLALEGAYHGDTFGAMSIGQRSYFNQPFESLFFDADYLAFPTAENEAENLEKAEHLFKTGEFVAVIVEPLVQGSAGMKMYSELFLDQLIKVAHQYDVLVIFDEVMTGWGRTGKMFAMNYCQEQPDFVCFSKGITGGVLPMGMTVTKSFIFDAFLDESKLKALLHGHSFTANPIACAAALASVKMFTEQETLDHIQRIEKRHSMFIQQIKGKYKLDDLRQRGTILALEISEGKKGSYFSNIREKALNFFLNNGMLLRPLGNVIFLNPPYCTTDEQLTYCYEKIEEFLTLYENSKI